MGTMTLFGNKSGMMGSQDWMAVAFMDPETELAPWFVSGMSSAELGAGLADLKDNGKIGNFLVHDPDRAGSSGMMFVLSVLEPKNVITAYFIERTSNQEYKLSTATSKTTFATIAELVDTHATKVIKPLKCTLKPSVSFLSAVSAEARGRTLKRRNDSVRSMISTTEPDGDVVGGISGLFQSLETANENELASEEALAVASAKLEQLETAVKLREKLRAHSEVLAASDKRTSMMQDPFWQDKQEALEREESFKQRFVEDEEKENELKEQARRAREKLAQLELKAQSKQLRKAKRMSSVHTGSQHVPKPTYDPADEILSAIQSGVKENPIAVDDEDDSSYGFSRNNSVISGFGRIEEEEDEEESEKPEPPKTIEEVARIASDDSDGSGTPTTRKRVWRRDSKASNPEMKDVSYGFGAEVVNVPTTKPKKRGLSRMFRK